MQNILITSLMDDDVEFIPILADSEDSELTNVEVPDILPILPLRNTVMFPGVVMPITVGRQKSLQLIQEVYKGNRLLGTVAQKDGSVDDPGQEDLYQTGTIAQVLKILEMPDGTTSVIIQGKKRFEVVEYTQESPYLKARINPMIDIQPLDDSVEFSSVVWYLKDLSIKFAQYSIHSFQVWGLQSIFNYFETFFPLNNYRSGSIRHFQNFQNLCNGSGLVQILLPRIVYTSIFLGNGSKQPVSLVNFLNQLK